MDSDFGGPQFGAPSPLWGYGYPTFTLQYMASYGGAQAAPPASAAYNFSWSGAFLSDLFSWQSAKQAQVDAWNKGYYTCLAKKNLPGFSAAATTHAVTDVASETASRFAPQVAGAYYHFTDARFTAWGKFSQVLVPEAAASIKLWAGRLNAASWAFADYELAESLGACSEVLQ